MKNLTDTEIIDSVLKGNPADFTLLINRYKGKAFSLLKRMLKNEMDAEEVLQDCFLKAYQSLNNFRQDAKFSTWFYRIVYNSALTKLSGKKRQIESGMISIEDEYDLADTSVNSEEKELTAALNNLVEKLPAKYSSVISMHYLDEMSCEEISSVLNTSVSNVKVLLHRSRNILRDIVIKNNLAEELR